MWDLNLIASHLAQNGPNAGGDKRECKIECDQQEADIPCFDQGSCADSHADDLQHPKIEPIEKLSGVKNRCLPIGDWSEIGHGSVDQR
jgi:hypothetical protein